MLARLEERGKELRTTKPGAGRICSALSNTDKGGTTAHKSQHTERRVETH